MAAGAFLLRGFALETQDLLLSALSDIVAISPFRHMVTRGSHVMSVAMTNCGKAGWVSDHHGYRYETIDPEKGQPWPLMPDIFMSLARSAADRAGYLDFCPDMCLINRYQPGSKLSLHQDKDESDFTQPIVSVSLGLPAIFQFGGLRRRDEIKKYPLYHGDVVVWGGASRLCHHGILMLKKGMHPKVGSIRLNLTFRQAL